MKSNKSYIIGLIFYLIPVLLLIIYYFNYVFIQIKVRQSWNAFLISLVPSTFIGLIFYIIGIFKKNKSKQEKTIGIIGIIYGIVLLILLVITFSLLLLVLQSF